MVIFVGRSDFPFLMVSFRVSESSPFWLPLSLGFPSLSLLDISLIMEEELSKNESLSNIPFFCCSYYFYTDQQIVGSVTCFLCWSDSLYLLTL